MACGTNNIDSISRIGFASAQKYFEKILGQGITANIIEGIKRSEVILIIGGDPTAVNPILGLSIREAARRGTRILILGHAKGLERFEPLQVIPPLFKEADVLESLLVKIADVKGVRGEKTVLDGGIRELFERESSRMELQGLDEFKDILLESASTSIVFGMDLVQRTDGHRSLFAVAGLDYLLEARLYLLSDRPNEQGLIDVGCLPDMLPGGRPVNIDSFRMEFEGPWNGPVLPYNGLTLMEIIEGAKNKNIKALYVMGENLAYNLPKSSHIKDALNSLDFLVVQDIFLSETAELADVVLPALGWSEKDGTYTNLERRIQLLRKAVENPSGMDDWKIISEVSKKMGYPMDYSCSEDIMEEISRVSPLYRDLTYKVIAEGGSMWPYHGEPLRGEVKEIPAATTDSRSYKGDLYLALERPLFHSGTISRRSSALRKIYPEPGLRIGTGHAGKLGLNDGDRVNVSTAHGDINVLVTIDDSIKDNKVLLSNNFEGKGVFSLLDYSIDPVTKAPGIEGCEVTIKKEG